MTRLSSFALAVTLPALGWAQTTVETETLPSIGSEETIGGGITVETLDLGQSEPLSLGGGRRAAPVMAVRGAPGAVLRGLDKVAGTVTDIDLATGGSTRYGTLTVALGECRVPVANPTGDAFARLTVTVDGFEAPAFDGWMIASSPALSALDHPRYDVWVIRCSSV
ncbi:MAG: DUF2155 domain-containing protein [Pseudomonadota bacterium]